MNINNKSGVALILVLWVIAIMMIIAFSFSYSMKTEAKIASNYKKLSQAYYYARAGVNHAILDLLLRCQGEKENRFNISGIPETLSWDEGGYNIIIKDEGAKFNLNKMNAKQLRDIFSKCDLKKEEVDIIVDSILDWRDKDELHRLNGAESDYYQTLDPPYSCKNGNFDTIGELLLVKGITPEIYHNLELEDIFTVFGHSSKININSASKKVLSLVPGMTDEMIDKIISARNEKEFTHINELIPIIGMNAYRTVYRYLTTSLTYYFSIISVGWIHGLRMGRAIKTTIKITPKQKEKYKILYWHDEKIYERALNDIFSKRAWH
ncbi:MAG: hypothetical protein DRG20_01815 [Deltaproteobacteria bacterium]|nr:general secretion pathway protein GspK [Deltaproteobacteria bacterium]RLA91297.1 MAG: hypothetical protein DRG20_01815 [Deltaproteobacteria bacterium]